jgi:hypothetical protein
VLKCFGAKAKTPAEVVAQAARFVEEPNVWSVGQARSAPSVLNDPIVTRVDFSGCNMPTITTVDKKTLRLLESYPWLGNIREIQNVIEPSVIVSETATFSVDESYLSQQPPERKAESPHCETTMRNTNVVLTARWRQPVEERPLVSYFSDARRRCCTADTGGQTLTILRC